MICIKKWPEMERRTPVRLFSRRYPCRTGMRRSWTQKGPSVHQANPLPVMDRRLIQCKRNRSALSPPAPRRHVGWAKREACPSGRRDNRTDENYKNTESLSSFPSRTEYPNAYGVSRHPRHKILFPPTGLTPTPTTAQPTEPNPQPALFTW